MLRLMQKADLMHRIKCHEDDIVIHNRTAEEHLMHDRAVLQKFSDSGLKAHPREALFMTDTVEFLAIAREQEANLVS